MKSELSIPKSRIFNTLGNILIILCYLNFCIIYITSYSETHNLSSLMYAIYDSVILVFLFVRKQESISSDNFWYWIAALGGTFIDLLMRPYPSSTEFSYWLIPQCIGIAISFVGLLSLNRGFGIIVGNRGIHSKGMYRFIRHPLYAGYFLTILSFFVQHISLWNLIVFILFFGLQILRIHNEEKFLSNDPIYLNYIKHTKWRLVPLIW